MSLCWCLEYIKTLVETGWGPDPLNEADGSWPIPVPRSSLLLENWCQILCCSCCEYRVPWTGTSLGKIAGWDRETEGRLRARWEEALKFVSCVSLQVGGMVRAVTLAACCSSCIYNV